MYKIGELEFSYVVPAVGREYKRKKVCIDMNFIAHKEEENKIIASYIYGWMGKKGKNDLGGLTWRQKDIDRRYDRSFVSKVNRTLPRTSIIMVVKDGSVTVSQYQIEPRQQPTSYLITVVHAMSEWDDIEGDAQRRGEEVALDQSATILQLNSVQPLP